MHDQLDFSYMYVGMPWGDCIEKAPNLRTKWVVAKTVALAIEYQIKFKIDEQDAFNMAANKICDEIEEDFTKWSALS